MSSEISPVVAVERRAMDGFTSTGVVDVDALGVSASPIAVIDDFRVRTTPFSPHPHAGFAAATYVMRDSHGSVRSRASTGEDVTVGPGGIVWTEAGRGVIHEEVPADPARELHGLQLFINLSRENKLAEPAVRHLDPSDVPEWRSPTGDRVRVVVGSFGGLNSPLKTAEPFTMLDIDITGRITYELASACNAIVYVLSGALSVGTDDGQEVSVGSAQAVAVRGGPALVALSAAEPAVVLVISGRQIDEPVVAYGPFILNDAAQVADAIHRFQSGAMGRLEPLVR